ncbi:hypothetical protein CcaCcLH18_07419 [Colletotrichum camelliae]|nr:hypothetical protein CcaCcLH18_07419 [Colletotrichum camelliae]
MADPVGFRMNTGYLMDDDQIGRRGLQLIEDVPGSTLGDHDVLVQIEAVSLDYRDLAIPRGLYPFAMKMPVIAGSDGAGMVLVAGLKMTGFTAVGAVDGSLRKHAVFPDHGLVAAPSTLISVEANTLTCAALTAWNALFVLKKLKADDWVMIQGSGGMGGSHVINYREVTEWGEAARALTPKGLGFDHILEIGGAATVVQSLKAIKLEGIITMIGFLTSAENDKQPNLMEALNHICTVRGIFVGSREQFTELNRAIDDWKVKPVVDAKAFRFGEAKMAYEHLWGRMNLGKVVVKI